MEAINITHRWGQSFKITIIYLIGSQILPSADGQSGHVLGDMVNYDALETRTIKETACLDPELRLAENQSIAGKRSMAGPSRRRIDSIYT